MHGLTKVFIALSIVKVNHRIFKIIIEAHFISHFTEDDMKAKKFPVYAILFVKRLGRMWRKKNEEKRKSLFGEGEGSSYFQSSDMVKATEDYNKNVVTKTVKSTVKI